MWAQYFIWGANPSVSFCRIRPETKGVSKFCANQEMPYLERTFNLCLLLRHIDVGVTFIASWCAWNCTSCACTSALTGQGFLVLPLCQTRSRETSFSWMSCDFYHLAFLGYSTGPGCSKNVVVSDLYRSIFGKRSINIVSLCII